MRASETLQGELGSGEAELRAARALLQVQAASHWGLVLAGTLKGEALLAQGSQTGIWITTTCVRAADACFALGGSSALYVRSPLQRLLRDLHVAAQHAIARQRHYVGLASCYSIAPSSAQRTATEMVVAASDGDTDDHAVHVADVQRTQDLDHA
jgi:Acyl-CoA dehydrogenase, C-terminal domain